jgi:pimeloyl-ACP methyl ester carboxylesterase
MRLIIALLFVLIALPAGAAERWETLPATPAPIPAERSGHAAVNGISVYYAVYGSGPPVILLHGGLANANYWGNQIRALALHRTVIVMDSRGHGRSTRDARPYGYDLMADDVVGLLDFGKIFAFAANTVPSGVKDDVEKNPTFAAFIKRAGGEYAAMSATPKEYDAFVEQISKMWASEPNWTDAQLKAIAAPVLVVDGDHDEAIKREHTEYIAATIPGAGLLLLPNASHFAFLQDSDLFSFAVLHFLEEK